MNESSLPTNRLPSLARKLTALATSSAALGIYAPTASAALVTSPTIPVGGLQPPAVPGAINWDVDNDGTVDFLLDHDPASLGFADFEDANGGRLVVPATLSQDGIAKLPSSFEVGPTLAGGYKFHAAAQNNNSITHISGIGSGASQGGWAVGDTGFFGFKFSSGGVDHFGFGIMAISNSGPAGQGYKILNAWYDTEPGAAVHVQELAVPEASSSLAMLTLGAAGLIAWRRQRAKSHQADESTAAV